MSASGGRTWLLAGALCGLVVLLDQAAPLERGQQARRRGLVQAEPARQLRDAGLAGTLAKGQQQGGRPIVLERGGNFQQSFLAQLADVAGAVRRRVAPAVPAEEGIASLALIERCRERRVKPG